MLPSRFKLTTAMLSPLLKTITVVSLVVGLSACNENSQPQEKAAVKAPVSVAKVAQLVVPNILMATQSANFILKGENLNTVSIVNVADCANLKINSQAVTQISFSCTPSTEGTKAVTVKSSGNVVVFTQNIVVQHQQTATLAKDVIFVDAAKSQEVINTQINDITGNSEITVLATSVIAKTPVGKVVMLAAGKESRYPLGLTGRVVSVKDVSGQKVVELKPVTLIEAFDKLDVSYDMPITADSLTRVISPEWDTTDSIAPVTARGRIRAASSSADKCNGRSKSKFAFLNKNFKNDVSLGGAVEDGKLFGLIPMTSADPDKVGFELKLKRPFYDEDCDPSTTNDQATIAVTLKFEDAIAKSAIKVDKDDAKDPVKSAKLEFTGTLSANVAVTGKVAFGTDSFLDSTEIWKRFEKTASGVTGAKLTFTGLSDEDKKTQIPLACFLISVAGGVPVPVSIGGNDDILSATLSTASLGGGVACVSLKTGINVDGKAEFGIELNKAILVYGLDAQSDGNGSITTTPVKKIERSPLAVVNQPLLKLPYVKGSVDITANAGFNLSVDGFVAGIRPLSISADIGAEAHQNAKGELAYVSDLDGTPFRFDANGCLSNYDIGAGVKFAILASFGVELQLKLLGYSNTVAAKGDYEFRAPGKDEIKIPGWHGLWYQSPASKKACYGKAEVIPAFVYSQGKTTAQGYEVSFDASTAKADDATGDKKTWVFVIDGQPLPYSPPALATERVFRHTFTTAGDHKVVLKIKGEYSDEQMVEQTITIKTVDRKSVV